jgi:sporulation protein YlmC with PRC-barrel domain
MVLLLRTEAHAAGLLNTGAGIDILNFFTNKSLHAYFIKPISTERNMDYEAINTKDLNKNIEDTNGPGPQIMGANTLIGNDVYNRQEEDLGDIKEIMLDMESGKIAYAVLSHGGILGVGEKLFAVPWGALTLDTDKERFVLNVEKAKLDVAPGFDSDNWPDRPDPMWTNQI